MRFLRSLLAKGKINCLPSCASSSYSGPAVRSSALATYSSIAALTSLTVADWGSSAGRAFRASSLQGLEPLRGNVVGEAEPERKANLPLRVCPVEPK
jgi:hypothetical protein